MDRVLSFTMDTMIGNTVDFRADREDGTLSVELDHPWAGDTESGFGYTLSDTLTPEQVAELLAWLQFHFGKK